MAAKGLLLAVTATALLAGCLDGMDGSATARAATRGGVGLEPAPLALPTALEYVCPPGPTTMRSGVCVTRLVSQTESGVEPYLAIHPAKPQVMAIGVNARHTVDAVARQGNEVHVRQGSMDFFFTETGGASWRRVVLPYIAIQGANPTPVQSGFAGDPALEFDAEGTLHVSALVSSSGAAGVVGGIGVIYTSTKDLGRTWTPAVTLARDSSNDRNWITLGPNGEIYVPWQKPGSTVEVAWSLDNGATWKQQKPAQRPRACFTVSIVVVHAEAPLFACAGGRGGALTGIQIFELDNLTGETRQRANLTELPCIWPQLTRVADGSLVLIAEACRQGGTTTNGLRLARSVDGGRTWTAPVFLTPNTKAKVDITMWLAPDPWGGLHLLATRAYSDLEHVLLDPTDFSVRWSRIIRPATPASVPPKVPDGFPAISGGDHYYGLAFTKDDGYAAWASEYGVDFARWTPTFEAAAPVAK